MNKFLKKGLATAGKYALRQLIKELEVGEIIKEEVKSRLLYGETINRWDSFELHNELTGYLIKHFPDKITNKQTKIYYDYDVKGNGSYRFVYFIDKLKLFVKINGVYMYIKKSTETAENSYADGKSNKFEIYTLKKNKEKLNEFLGSLTENIKSSLVKTEKIRTYTLTKDGWETYRVYTPMHIDKVILDPKIKNKLMDDIDSFLDLKQWYIKRNLSFKRGYLLYGSPRNGKSSLIAALARKYNRDIYFLNLNTLSGDDALQKAFRDIKPESMLVIEDIDTVWNKREAVNKDCKITFSTFINLMSGVLEKQDILIFFTTNFYDKLDKALIGSKRIDFQIEVPNPRKAEAEAYLEDLYESDFSLKHYTEGRSMGALFNLFEEHRNDKQTLINFLETEDPNKTFDEEPYEPKKRYVNTSDHPELPENTEIIEDDNE